MPRYYSCAVLVIMHDRDIRAFAQLSFDDETSGRSGIFKVDAKTPIQQPR
jgi:hypothetical protein